VSTVRIALAQVAVTADRAANRCDGLAVLARAATDGARLICYPEMGFDPFFPQHRADPRYFDWAEPIPGPTVEAFSASARRHGIVAVLNLYERAAPGEYYDASPVIDADGTLRGTSRMIHIAEAPQFNEKFYYRPGNTGFPVFPTAAMPIGVAVCYDRHYPEQMRALTIQGAELILVPLAAVAANLWEIFEVEMRAAAYQNQVYIAVVNRVGVDGEMTFLGRSFVVDPSGTVIARAASDEPDLLLVDLDPDAIEQARRVTPHLRDRRPDQYRIIWER
jgi:N-carbamoylputrescine amidase